MNYSEKAKLRRESLKEQGICIDCGVVPADAGTRCVSCRDNQRTSNKMYREKHSKRLRVAKRKYFESNKDHINEYRRDYQTKYRKRVLESLGGECECCGQKQFEWLQIDHRNKDGKKHRTEVGRSITLWRDILKNPGKYDLRVLCANCHNAITCYGRCPHEQILQISENVPPSLESRHNQ